MGWTGLHRDKGLSDRAFFEREFPIGLTQQGKVIACATMPGSGEYQRVFYAAVQNNDTASYAPNKTWCLVVLMHWSRADYYNFHYKDMSEDMGPAEDECPAKILDLLSPTESEYAIEWRARCRAIAERKAQAKLKPGDQIQFEKPVPFGEPCGEATLFRFVGGKQFEALDGTGYQRFNCRLGASWWRRAFERVAA